MTVAVLWRWLCCGGGCGVAVAVVGRGLCGKLDQLYRTRANGVSESSGFLMSGANEGTSELALTAFFTHVFAGRAGRGPAARDRTSWRLRRHAVPAASQRLARTPEAEKDGSALTGHFARGGFAASASRREAPSTPRSHPEALTSFAPRMRRPGIELDARPPCDRSAVVQFPSELQFSLTDSLVAIAPRSYCSGELRSRLTTLAVRIEGSLRSPSHAPSGN